MALTPVFNGQVTKDGRLVLNDDERFLRKQHLLALAGHDVEVVVRKRRIKRTLDQNAYWHSKPFPILAEHFGLSVEEVKYVLMGECWGWHRDKVTGREIPIKPSTSSMTVEEGTFFQDWLLPWAMTEHGVDIPPPEKVDY